MCSRKRTITAYQFTDKFRSPRNIKSKKTRQMLREWSQIEDGWGTTLKLILNLVGNLIKWKEDIGRKWPQICPTANKLW